MLVYDGTKSDFLKSVEQDTIAVEIEENIYQKMNRHSARNEFRSWENSLEYMYKVLNDKDIPCDVGIAIEYNIPQTSKRIDFLISGYDGDDHSNVVIIELKQWDNDYVSGQGSTTDPSGNEVVLLIRVPDEEKVNELIDWIKSLDTAYVEDKTFEDVVYEEGRAYLEGDKSLEEVMGAIETRIGIYLAE